MNKATLAIEKIRSNNNRVTHTNVREKLARIINRKLNPSIKEQLAKIVAYILREKENASDRS